MPANRLPCLAADRRVARDAPSGILRKKSGRIE